MGIDGFLKETILAAFFGLVRSATTVGQTSVPLQKVSSVHQSKLIHRKTNTVLVVQVISPAVESCGQMRARSQLEQISGKTKKKINIYISFHMCDRKYSMIFQF